MTAGMFSSLHGDWRTPEALYNGLDEEFNFDFDPCPTDPQFDGLTCMWGSRNFVNPPYGDEITAWLRKAVEEHRMGRLVVLLLPARTDTAWWHDLVMPNADEIRFIRGRVSIEGHNGKGAPFPSVVVVFR